MKCEWNVFMAGIAVVLFTKLTFQQHQEFDLKASMKRGKEIYIAQCLKCHKENGEGVEALYPPLAKADYMMADRKRSIQQTLYGVTGEIIVNGKTYNVEMKAIDLTNDEASDVLNYIRNSWGNEGTAITPDEVEGARNK